MNKWFSLLTLSFLSMSFGMFGYKVTESTKIAEKQVQGAPEKIIPWWFKADLLYTKARLGRLQFATQPQDWDAHIYPNKFSLISPHYEWKWGFRLEAGHQWKKWGIFLTWTEMSGGAHRKISLPFGEGFFPVWSLQPDLFVQDQVQKGKLHWDADIDLIDLGAKVGLFNIKKWFSLQSKMGLRGGWITEKVKVNYSKGIFVGGTDLVKMKIQHFGLGPFLSLDPKFILGRGVSLAGSFAVTSFFTKFHTHQHEIYLEENLFQKNHDFWKTQWIFDLFGFLQWERQFRRHSLMLQAGYEFHKFSQENRLSQNQFHLLNDFTRNLFISGVFGSVCLGF